MWPFSKKKSEDQEVKDAEQAGAAGSPARAEQTSSAEDTQAGAAAAAPQAEFTAFSIDGARCIHHRCRQNSTICECVHFAGLPIDKLVPEHSVHPVPRAHKHRV